MSLERDGFLSTEAPAWIAEIRVRNTIRFALAEKLNRLAQRIATRELDVVTEAGFSDARILTLLLFYRATSNFQGTVLMAERGMIVEARTLARSGLETAIHIAALKGDPGHVRNLLHDELASRKQRAKIILKNPSVLSPEVADRLRAYLDDLEKRGKLSKSTLEDLASKAGIEGVYLFYRQLSADAAHPTVTALNRYVATDKELDIKGTHCLPRLDHDEIGSTLQYGCMFLILACTVINELFPSDTFNQELAECYAEYEKLEAGPIEAGV